MNHWDLMRGYEAFMDREHAKYYDYGDDDEEDEEEDEE